MENLVIIGAIIIIVSCAARNWKRATQKEFEEMYERKRDCKGRYVAKV